MERFYVESRAIDVESLCIVAGEKVCILQNNYKSVFDFGTSFIDS